MLFQPFWRIMNEGHIDLFMILRGWLGENLAAPISRGGSFRN